jgi:hypothetical protein
MQKIKFSHRYWKMPVVVEHKPTYIVGVNKVHYKDLPAGFVTYDTLYPSEDEVREIRYYPLPKTDLIILTLFTDSEQSPKVWTTIRRYTSKKFEYYKKLMMKEVNIVLTSTTENK